MRKRNIGTNEETLVGSEKYSCLKFLCQPRLLFICGACLLGSASAVSLWNTERLEEVKFNLNIVLKLARILYNGKYNNLQRTYIQDIRICVGFDVDICFRVT